jgi:hypothetical protein
LLLPSIDFLFWWIWISDLLLRQPNWAEIVMNFAKFIINRKLLNALILLTVVAGFLWGILIVFFMMYSKSIIILIIWTWIDNIRDKFVYWDNLRFPHYLIVYGCTHFDNIVIFFIIFTCVPVIAWTLTMKPGFWLLFLILSLLD